MEDLATDSTSSTMPMATVIQAGEAAEKDIAGLVGLIVAVMRLVVVLMGNL